MTREAIERVYKRALVIRFPGDKKVSMNHYPDHKKYCLDKAGSLFVSAPVEKRADILIVNDGESSEEVIIAIAEVGGSKYFSEAKAQLTSSVKRLLKETFKAGESRYSVYALWIGAKSQQTAHKRRSAKSRGSARAKIKKGFTVNGFRIVPVVISNRAEPIWNRVANKTNRIQIS